MKVVFTGYDMLAGVSVPVTSEIADVKRVEIYNDSVWIEAHDSSTFYDDQGNEVGHIDLDLPPGMIMEIEEE